MADPDNLTLTFGVRYEYPGDPFSYLRELNGGILVANGNNPLFRLGPLPETDTNNLMPRIGFNWNPRTAKRGSAAFLREETSSWSVAVIRERMTRSL